MHRVQPDIRPSDVAYSRLDLTMDLHQLTQTETDRIEWKESADTSELLRTVCALANDLGASGQSGYLLLGVDKRGKRVGIDLSKNTLDEELQRLASRLSSVKLYPSPSYSLSDCNDGGRTVIVVEVRAYPVPPVVTVDGIAWVRRGSATMRASEADLARLRERRPEHAQSFDLRVVPGATLQDLNVTRMESHYAAARQEASEPEQFPSLTSWLTQRQLGRSVGGVWRPNAAALLVFGVSPQDRFPGATVEFVRYGGVEVDAPVVERATASGTLPDQIDSLWSRLNAHLVRMPVSGEGMTTIYRPQYPPGALKELVRNLVQHRAYEGTNAPGRIEWFDDRIEFSNPGGPFGRASEGEFGTHTDYRNPVITGWLVHLGYVEQLGRGIRLVRLALSKNGNPSLEVEIDGFTRIAIRRVP